MARIGYAIVIVIIVSGLFYVFLCRGASRSIAETGFAGNRMILAGIVFELMLLIVVGYTPWGHTLLATESVHSRIWFYAGLFAVGMIVLEELRKWFTRHGTAGKTSRKVDRICSE